MSRARRTAAFTHYAKTFTCPNGHRGSVRFLEGSGPILTELRLRDKLMREKSDLTSDQTSAAEALLRRLRLLNHDLAGAATLENFRQDTQLECLQCNLRWPVFLPEDTTFEIIGQRETHRTEEALGADVRVADGRASSADYLLTMTFERRWFRRLEFLWEQVTTKAVTGEAELTVSLPLVGAFVTRLAPSFEQAITMRSSGEERSEMTTGATLQVPVLAGTQTTVTLYWKQVWQHGIWEVRMITTGELLEVPFQRAVEVTFDPEVQHGTSIRP